MQPNIKIQEKFLTIQPNKKDTGGIPDNFLFWPTHISTEREAALAKWILKRSKRRTPWQNLQQCLWCPQPPWTWTSRYCVFPCGRYDGHDTVPTLSNCIHSNSTCFSPPPSPTPMQPIRILRKQIKEKMVGSVDHLQHRQLTPLSFLAPTSTCFNSAFSYDNDNPPSSYWLARLEVQPSTNDLHFNPAILLIAIQKR